MWRRGEVGGCVGGVSARQGSLLLMLLGNRCGKCSHFLTSTNPPGKPTLSPGPEAESEAIVKCWLSPSLAWVGMEAPQVLLRLREASLMFISSQFGLRGIKQQSIRRTRGSCCPGA